MAPCYLVSSIAALLRLVPSYYIEATPIIRTIPRVRFVPPALER